jgi:hypothetical protein
MHIWVSEITLFSAGFRGARQKPSMLEPKSLGQLFSNCNGGTKW